MLHFALMLATNDRKCSRLPLKDRSIDPNALNAMLRPIVDCIGAEW